MMQITMKEFVSIGYDPLKASRIMNEICRMTPYTTIDKFVTVKIKGIVTTQYQKLRAVSLESIFEVCEHKISHPRTNTSIKRWEELRDPLADFKHKEIEHV